MRVALGIEYCGSQYSGWQRQGHLINSVQQYVEESLSKIADQRIIVHCAGRTDTGVHALFQIVHFETSAKRSMYSWVAGGNANLPDNISIFWGSEVADDFHARFSATSRIYRYVILNRRYRPGACHGMVTWERRPLDEACMQLAASSLLGKHDFSSFRASGCQAATPVRNIEKLQIYRKNNYVVFEIEANAFLQRMVRNIAGVLMEIGSGKADVSWVVDVLSAKNRKKAAKTAAPDGLYLVGVRYPEKYGIPEPTNLGGVFF